MRICFSEHCYPIETADLLALPDSAMTEGGSTAEAVVLLLGHAARGEGDSLLRGRDVLLRAQQDGVTHVSVRIAFRPVLPWWHPGVYISKLRKRYKAFGSGRYHVAPAALRGMAIERGARTAENAYQFTSRRYRVSDDVRMNRYHGLRESLLRNGWCDEKPLAVMLRRSGGVVDSLDNGHHRLGLCIEHNITRVTVLFCYAGCAPQYCCRAHR